MKAVTHAKPSPSKMAVGSENFCRASFFYFYFYFLVIFFRAQLVILVMKLLFSVSEASIYLFIRFFGFGVFYVASFEPSFFVLF